jgi:hypothetical protein
LGYFGLEGQGLLGHGVNCLFLDIKFGHFSSKKAAAKFIAACCGLAAVPTDQIWC